MYYSPSSLQYMQSLLGQLEIMCFLLVNKSNNLIKLYLETKSFLDFFSTSFVFLSDVLYN